MPAAVERIMYRGILFTRWPESTRRQHRVYYHPSKTKREQGVGALHVEVYRNEVGGIPQGWHVHHISEDPLDNRAENLEALSPAEHARLHSGDGWGRTDPEHMARIRKLAAVWHGSPEGREWHKQHGRSVWVGRKPEIGAELCFGCGAEVTSYRPTQGGRRWCSRACNARWDHKNLTYSEDTSCPECGIVFRRVKKGVRSVQFCSRRCSARTRERAKRGV